MATVVPFAYCYGNSTLHQPLQLFGKGRKCGYMSLIAYRSPCNVPRPRLACNAPKLTLRQICRMLRVMRYEAAAAANNRKQASSPPPPGSPAKSDRRCLPSCFRRRRNTKSPPPNLPTTVSTQTSTENPETQKTCIFPIWRGQKWTSD